LPVGAEVVAGTGIAVVASAICGKVDTTDSGVAGIGGAGAEVITIGGATAAPSRLADIVVGTSIAVVTGGDIGCKSAPAFRAAAIVGARVVVRTDERWSPRTFTEAAQVFGRAEVAVVTRSAIQRMDAAAGGVAVIGGADVLIVTVGGDGADALATDTLIYGCAGISVVALPCGGGVEAEAVSPVTGIRSADVIIIAIHCGSGLALTIRADIAGRAEVIVVARNHYVFVLTASVCEAKVFGAWVAIVAIEVPATDTHSRLALILGGAGVVVIAK